MKKLFKSILGRTLAVAIPLAFVSGPSSAWELAVGNYGNSTSAWPYAVAFEGGFFKRENIDITGIRGSSGGTGDVRALLAGDLPYVTSSLVAVLSAVKEGADIKIVGENVHTSSTFQWVVKKDSPINSAKDLKGKRMAFTTPQSTSEMLSIMLLGTAGFSRSDATMIAAGGYGPGLTLLDNGGADVVAVSEPNFTMTHDKYKVIARSADLFPPMDSDLSITSGKMAKEQPALLKSIGVSHRKAVEYMYSNRKESAAYIEKVYKLGPGVVEEVLNRILDHGDTQGVPYFGKGEIIAADFDNLINGLKLVGALKDNNVQWRSIVDQNFLADDLKKSLN